MSRSRSASSSLVAPPAALTLQDVLVRELPGTLVPADVLPRFADLPGLCLLESGADHAGRGRYSYLVAEPRLRLQAHGRRVVLRGHGAERPVPLAGDPFGAAGALLRRYQRPPLPGLPPFQGGWVGLFGFDLGGWLERLPRRAVDDLGLPDLDLGLYDWCLAWDHRHGRAWLLCGLLEGADASASARARDILARLASPPPPAPPPPPTPPARATSTLDRAAYGEMVRRALAYIRAGDIYQVNLSQRLAAPLREPPLTIYRRLRRASPAPFAAYLAGEGYTLASGSPEEFLRLEADGRVETRPIKGTRPRARDPERDAALRADLASNAKDRAENLMIVDLLRNDLGRVCAVGSVRVPELFAIESYSTVHQLVSTVTGRLAPGRDAVDLLRACFPGGSVTGCPKIRALEIIDELEPTRRGPYCGSIGAWSVTGALVTSIVIRTLVIAGGVCYLQVGGAVVADSTAEGEYQETLDKARAGLQAIGAMV